SAGDGMGGGAIEWRSRRHRSEPDGQFRLQGCSGRKLSAARWTGCLSVFRAFRSAEYSRHRKNPARGGGGKNRNHSADQTLSGGENVVRAFLDAAVTRILATRTRREIFPATAKSYSVFLASRSDSPAPACGYSATGDP